jgi:hypothetical protein
MDDHFQRDFAALYTKHARGNSREVAAVGHGRVASVAALSHKRQKACDADFASRPNGCKLGRRW